jgi:hypothetical protein
VDVRKENTAMAAVQRIVIQAEGPPILHVAGSCAELGGGDEAFRDAGAPDLGIQEAEHGRSSMELAVASAEGMAGEQAEPVLAGEGGAYEPLGLVRREAEKDLLDKLGW